MFAQPAPLHMSKRSFGCLDGAVHVHCGKWQLHIDYFCPGFFQYKQRSTPGGTHFGVKWSNKILLWYTKRDPLQRKCLTSLWASDQCGCGATRWTRDAIGITRVIAYNGIEDNGTI